MRAMLGAAVAACLMLLPVYAGAADKSGPDKFLEEVQAPPARHNRTGFYAGALAGWGVADFQADTFQFSDAAPLAGAFAGINIRLPSSPLVVGLEGDYVWTDISATPGAIVIAKTSYLASIRARAGLAIGPALLYITGGPAFTEADVDAGGIVSKETLVGAALGGGVEAELTKVLFVRLEAIHYVFPDKDLSCGVGCAFESQNQHTTARFAVGFKLN